MKWHGAWLHGVHRMCWDGSSFMWHQPCQCCKYTTSVDIQKLTVKDIHSCRITCERSESAREWRIALYKSDHQSVRHRNVSGQEADWIITLRYFTLAQLSFGDTTPLESQFVGWGLDFEKNKTKQKLLQDRTLVLFYFFIFFFFDGLKTYLQAGTVSQHSAFSYF